MEHIVERTIESYLVRCIEDVVDVELLLMHFSPTEVLQAEERGFILREETEDSNGLHCSHRIDFVALRRAGHQRVFG